MSQGVQQVQLPQGVQLVQLPQGVQLPPAPAACPPSYPWGQQVVTGTSLVPQQPMGLGPWAGVQGQSLYPTGSYHLPVPKKHRGPAAHRAQGPAVSHTLPGSAQEPAEASGRDGVAVELCVPAASPHQPALAAPAGTTTGEPTGAVTTPAALGSPGDLPQQGPDACTEGIPELAQDTASNDVSAWLDVMDVGDAIPNVPDSPDLAAFLRELPDLSEAQDTSPRERGPVALGLQDGEVTSPVPSSPAFLSRLPDLSDLLEMDGFWEPAAEITHPQDQVVLSPLGDSGDTGCSTHGTSVTNEVYNELPKAEGGCTEEPAAVEPLPDGATELPPRLQRSPLQSPEQSPQEPAEDSPLAGPCRDPQLDELMWPWLSPLQITLLSPLSSPLLAPQTDELKWPWLSPLRIPLLSPLSSLPPAPQLEEVKRPWLSPM
nr:uncharacterized protein LOC110362487 [Columba livia]